MTDLEFHAPAIVYGPQWPVPFVPVRDQVLRAAANHGDRIALEDADREVTYAELEQQSRAVGNWLRRRSPDESRQQRVVAVVGGRSPQLIPALLGVWRAGAAYLPIDASYPIERIRLLIDDSDPSAVIIDADTTAAALVAELLEHGDAALLADVLTEGTTDLESFEDVELLPHDLAYLIYTSGSTGRPKGAQLSQRNVVNFLAAHAHDVGLTVLDRHGWAGHVSFDASVSDIWPALAAGATLCLAPEEVPANLRALLEWLRSARITTTLIGTVIVNILFGMDDRWWEGLSLRFVITGGDRLTRRPPVGLPFLFVNGYGPTECTVWATTARPEVTPRDGDDLAPTIGTPIVNSFVAILDENLRPCNVGEQGEICIGGAGVGLGYLGRPDVTREHFIDDVYSSPSGGTHLYRTGDQGLLQLDGEIRFIGRSDRQIALHGYRIEAGEVEAGILESASVKEAVVKRHDFAGLGPRVVAFITFRDPDAHESVHDVRERMQERLPSYMIPNQFVVLDEMPLTPNGKVDENKLVPPRRERAEFDEPFVEPRTVTETRLCKIFTDVLALDRVGADDDFFALGGDSLGGVEAMTVIEEQFHVELGAGTIQDHPTARSFAAFLDGDQTDVEIDWEAEARQDLLTIDERRLAPASPTVMVTGAHGFIGGQVTAHLLGLDPAVRVAVLVRSDEQARDLCAAAGADAHRIQVVTGDLAQPSLGIEPACWHDLTGSLTAIVHAGAEVNHTKSYAALRAANVGSTSEAARLAAEAGGIPLIYISSDSAGTGAAGLPPDNGYAQTKWVSERRLAVAAEAGLPVRVVRLERVLPDDAGQIVNASDTITVLAVASAACGVIADLAAAEPGTPVDVAAAAIAQLSLQHELDGFEVVYTPMAVFSWADIVAALRERGVEVVGWQAWLEALRAKHTRDTQRAMALIPLYRREDMLEDGREATAAQVAAARPQIDIGWSGFGEGYAERITAAMLSAAAD